MWVLILILVAITLVAMLIGHLSYKNKKVPPTITHVDSECCGQHEVCERESLLTAVSRGHIEYYNDEELDRFRGRGSDSYSYAEVEEFRDVMQTCREEEVAGWSRSLQLRGIELPDELKDELFLIVGERRMHP
ncbi:MAG: phospholipase [Bacteroidales bacterium]|nr:phospholipase [Bacteroidales bacterium]